MLWQCLTLSTACAQATSIIMLVSCLLWCQEICGHPGDNPVLHNPYGLPWRRSGLSILTGLPGYWNLSLTRSRQFLQISGIVNEPNFKHWPKCIPDMNAIVSTVVLVRYGAYGSFSVKLCHYIQACVPEGYFVVDSSMAAQHRLIVKLSLWAFYTYILLPIWDNPFLCYETD